MSASNADRRIMRTDRCRCGEYPEATHDLVLLRLHSNPLARQRPLLLRGNLRLNGLPPVRLQPNAAGSKP